MKSTISVGPAISGFLDKKLLRRISTCLAQFKIRAQCGCLLDLIRWDLLCDSFVKRNLCLAEGLIPADDLIVDFMRFYSTGSGTLLPIIFRGDLIALIGKFPFYPHDWSTGRLNPMMGLICWHLALFFQPFGKTLLPCNLLGRPRAWPLQTHRRWVRVLIRAQYHTGTVIRVDQLTQEQVLTERAYRSEAFYYPRRCDIVLAPRGNDPLGGKRWH